jgi:hypothetical protein
MQGTVLVKNVTVYDSFARAILYFNTAEINVINCTFVRYSTIL